MGAFPNLFRPIKIGSIELKNRIIFGPHANSLADYQTGFVTDQQVAYFEERARGGAGLIILGAASVHPSAFKRPGFNSIWSRDAIAGMARLAEAVHRHNCPIFSQLHHAGRQSTSDSSRMPLLAPSALPCPLNREVPHEMDKDDMRELLTAFAEAADIVRTSGFDGVEIYAAHGYLLGEFLSPFTNKRTDEYGGSLQGRIRFVDEVIEAVRAQVGPEFPIGVRISVDEFAPGGLVPDEVTAICRHLEEQHAIAYFSQSQSNYYSLPAIIPDMSTPHNAFVSLSAALKQGVQTPVAAVCRIVDPTEAEDVVAQGQADLIVMVRALIADPYLPLKAQEGRLDQLNPCIGCNLGCITRVSAALPISCVVNPAVGYEVTDSLSLRTKSNTPARALVIGGGPAGLKAAETLLARGHRVTIWEKEAQLGGQVRLAAQAPHRSELAELIRPLERNISQLGGEIVTGKAAAADDILAFAPEILVIATGSRAVVPEIPVEDCQVQLLTYEDAFSGISGRKVVVIDGGEAHFKCCCTAELLASRGHQVSIVTPVSGVGQEIEPFSRIPLLKRLRAAGVHFLTTRSLASIAGHTVTIRDTLSTETETLADVDAVVFCWFNQANNQLYYQLKEHVPRIYAVGDALAPRRLLNAVYDGYRKSAQV